MGCDVCKEAFSDDGTEPDCWDGECLLPPLCERGRRVLEIRSRLVSLHDLVDSGTILRMYRVTMDDIELLAAVEEEIRRLKPQKTHGA